MINRTMLYADRYVERYKTSSLMAALKLAEIWCEEPTECIDVWGCGFTNEKFFEHFLDHCNNKGFLKEALKIWWYVHNSPCSELEPCYSEQVYQQIIDYSIKHDLESETLHLKKYGLDKFKLIQEVEKLYKGKGLQFHNKRYAYVYTNPKDENGRFIPLIKNKDGETIHWPRHDVEDRFLTPEELDELGI